MLDRNEKSIYNKKIKKLKKKIEEGFYEISL